MFSLVPNLQTQEGVVICMPKPIPYKDIHSVPWNYDVTLISTRAGKEEVCSNISSGLSGLTRSGRCYTFEELENRRKEIGKSTAKLVRNSVDTIFCLAPKLIGIPNVKSKVSLAIWI